jgi:parallel beta-helix repeat protein
MKGQKRTRRNRRAMRKIGLGLALLVGLSLTLMNTDRTAAAGTPITTFPATISAPGTYMLMAGTTNFSGTAVMITSSDVTLQLNGKTLDGDDSCCGNNGIYVGTGMSNVSIIGPGTIKDFSDGIFFSGISDSFVSLVTLKSNQLSGIALLSGSNSNRIYRNQSTGNGDNGIYLGDSNFNEISLNVCSNNGDAGIQVTYDSDGNEVFNNTFSENYWGILLGGTADDNDILRNILSNNMEYGILADGTNIANRIKFNRVSSSNRGIVMMSGATGNTLERNYSLRNRTIDMRDETAGMCDNTWTTNFFNTKNGAASACIF